jgi:3-isopropylmalate/(R)-2-methylmalate dehydratase small subunit
MRFDGRVWIFGDYVDTDVMFPGAALRLSIAKASEHLFASIRPAWHLQVCPGDIVVGGSSFGAGSARPVGSLLRHVGVSAVLAESMSSLFQRNCLNSGLVALPAPGITAICSEGDRLSVDVDRGRVVNLNTGQELSVVRLPAPMQELVAAGGVLELLKRNGYLPAS